MKRPPQLSSKTLCMNQSSMCDQADPLPTSGALIADLTLGGPVVRVPESRLKIGMGVEDRIC
ncbi:hypothetical protein NHH03_27855 [Stieleria sp. TO1_6]|uniref:hypothetical protein n=1 Tax=Stieleria tagensis TaxID=2956795 RepID=UPI00209A7B52|nr:hypothetical protein [Stieleria tagensis]MCO8125586.1 hypothetical protein [Stieleria tagensis]